MRAKQILQPIQSPQQKFQQDNNTDRTSFLFFDENNSLNISQLNETGNSFSSKKFFFKNTQILLTPNKKINFDFSSLSNNKNNISILSGQNSLSNSIINSNSYNNNTIFSNIQHNIDTIKKKSYQKPPPIFSIARKLNEQRQLIRKSSIWEVEEQCTKEETNDLGQFAYSKKLELQRKTELQQFIKAYKSQGKYEKHDYNKQDQSSDSDDSNKQNNFTKDIHKRIIKNSLKMQMIPLKMQLIKESVDNTINMNNYQLGHHLKIFNEALKSEELKMTKKIKLNNNQIAPEDLTHLLKNIPSLIKKLHMAGSNIKIQGGIIFSLNLIEQKSKYIALVDLNLSDNCLKSEGAKHILEALQKLFVKKLNLGSNNLTDNVGEYVEQFLIKNSQIQELYLYWNRIGGKGGARIAKGINQNIGLVLINLAHNCLGKGYNCGPKLIKAICNKIQMKHVDLSYNFFQGIECISMGMQLNTNRTLYGLHMEGNANFYIDGLGFLKISANRVNSVLMTRKHTKGVKQQYLNKLQNKDYDAYDNCWICEGWIEQKFIFSLKYSSPSVEKGPIYLHLEYADYKPIRMHEDLHNPDVFFFLAMAPPEKSFQYFFVDPNQRIISIQQNQLKEKVFKPNFHTFSENYRVTYGDNFTKDLDITFEVPSVFNYKRTYLAKRIIDYNYKELVVAQPRDINNLKNEEKVDNRKYYYKIIKKQREILKREYLISHDKCFDRDFKYCQIGNFIKDYEDITKVQETMKKNYKAILNTFKTLVSNSGMVDNSFSLGINVLTEYFQRIGVIDRNLLCVRDFDINFIACNGQNLKVPLTRFQFVEFIIRIASEKYMRNNKCTNYSDAVDLLLRGGAQNAFDNIEDPIVWREYRFWKREVDDLILDRMQYLRKLNKEFCGKKRFNTQQYIDANFITIHEFRSIFDKFELIGENLQERDIIKAFAMAQEPVENDKDQEKYIQLTFDEFIEALARISEKLSMVPYGQPPESWTDEKRINQKLYQKFKNFLDFLENYDIIKMQGEETDLFDGQQFYKGTEKHELIITESNRQQINDLFKKKYLESIASNESGENESSSDEEEPIQSPKSRVVTPINSQSQKNLSSFDLQQKKSQQKFILKMLNSPKTLQKVQLTKEQQLVQLIKKERPDLMNTEKLTILELITIAKSTPRIAQQMVIEDSSEADKERINMLETIMNLQRLPAIIELNKKHQTKNNIFQSISSSGKVLPSLQKKGSIIIEEEKNDSSNNSDSNA